MAYVNLGLAMWPIGSLYFSSVSISPATIFGGTWTALNESRYLRLAGQFNTGGSDTISVNQMPAHTHKENTRINWSDATKPGQLTGGYSDSAHMLTDTIYSTTSSTGGGAAFYPSYRNVFAWYRTA